jgi:ribosomal RNA assembly protein
MAEYIKIPKDRIGVLIGEGGKTKGMVEKKSKVKLEIAQDGSVGIISPEEDGLSEWRVLDFVKAVGRGFNPKYAMNLLKEDYTLSVINLYDIFGRDADVARVKARIIGEEGKAWKTLETLTNTRLAVYGRTVAIIGLEPDVELAEKGINLIIKGAMHANVYRILEEERRQMRNQL